MSRSPQPESRPTEAVVLIAHGSRLAEANDDAHWMAEQLRRRGAGQAVEVAFLELAEPTIESAAARCVAAGASRVRLLPYFLSPGQHVRRDLEAWRQRLIERFPATSFQLCEPIGRHRLLVDVLGDRLGEGA